MTNFSRDINKFKLNEQQRDTFNWLKQQKLNTDDNTLAFWALKYSTSRLKEVINFAYARQNSGQNIQNIGGWVHKLLKSDAPVVNNTSKQNRDFAESFARINEWNDLHIYEKYVRDEITNDDLPLTIPIDEFKRSLEKLYNKSRLYKKL